MNYEIVEFIVNNREQIKAHINEKLAPALVASRIFDNNPDVQDAFINHNKLNILRDYIMDHFNLNPEELLLLNHELFEILERN